MPVIPFGRQTVVLVRRAVTGRDAHGNDVYTVTRETVSQCLVQPTLFSKEFISAEDRTVNRLQLFAPPNVNLKSIDAVEFNGERYEISGEPLPWPDWTGGVHHIEAILEKVAG